MTKRTSGTSRDDQDRHHVIALPTVHGGRSLHSSCVSDCTVIRREISHSRARAHAEIHLFLIRYFALVVGVARALR